VIADDLTGASNVGVLLSKQGFAPVVITHEALTLPLGHDVVCIDTDGRYIPADAAKRRAHEVAARAVASGAGVLCDRVDNLLRGNIGAHIDGILDVLGPGALAVVAPAFPALKRAVSGGHLLVDGVPVHRHPVAAGDPIAPVTTSFIPDLIAAQFATRIERVELQAVEAGAAHLAARLEKLARAGTRVVVVDATTEEHLQTIARAMAGLGRPLLPVDPGPLSGAYLRTCREAAQPGRGRKIIAAVGSVTDLSRRQLDRLVAARDIEPQRIDAAELIASPAQRATVIEQAIAACRQRLEHNDLVVLTTHAVSHERLDVDALAPQRGMLPHQLSRHISDGLAEATCAVIAHSAGAVGGCFASGGDLVSCLFKQAETDAIRILGDVVPLTAHLEFSGGLLHGLRLVTKGGSIGDDHTMEACVNHLADDLRRF
jgi:uncharacterized protein YgbK (DUF1537 family)